MRESMKLKEKLAMEYEFIAAKKPYEGSHADFLAGFEKAKELFLAYCNDSSTADFTASGYAFYTDVEKLGEEEV